MSHHSGVHGLLVVDASPDEAIQDAVDLGQQRRHLGRVLRMALRHRGREHLPLGLDADGQFLPAFLRLLAMLLGMPFAVATDLQARAVHEQGDRSLGRTFDLLSDCRDTPSCMWDVDAVVCEALACAAPLAVGWS